MFVGTFAPTSTCTVVGLAVWAEALESEATTAAADESGKSCAPFLCDRMLLERAFGDIIVPVELRGRSGGRGDVLRSMGLGLNEAACLMLAAAAADLAFFGQR